MEEFMKKTICVAFASLAVLALAGCNSSDSGKSATNATLTAAYSSPAVLTYVNMRPTYNYYLTTFEFEELETYSDNSYILTVSSSTYSALILPEEGNGVKGNERTNSLTKYYGSFTTEADSLDDDTLYITVSVPTRIVMAYDSSYYVDTDNWTDDMKTKSADITYDFDADTGTQTETGTHEYATGAEYLAAKKFIKEASISASIKNCSIEYTALTFAN
jgi:hypothetical protein